MCIRDRSPITPVSIQFVDDVLEEAGVLCVDVLEEAAVVLCVDEFCPILQDATPFHPQPSPITPVSAQLPAVLADVVASLQLAVPFHPQPSPITPVSIHC